MSAFDTANQERCISLRPYRSDDFKTIYALDRVCFGPRFRFSVTMMRKVVGARQAALQVACETDETGNETIVGFCAASPERRGRIQVGYIATLDVAPASRGRGIGRTLLLAAERDLAQKGAAEMRLHVFAGNAAAIRLYEAMAYALLRREPNFYGLGADALEYRKPLLS